MNKVTIKVNHFFEGVYLYLVLLLVMLGVIFLLFDYMIAGTLFFLAIIVFTTEYKLSVYKDEGQYRKYLWFLGMKKGKRHKFDSIEGLMIKKHKHEHHLSKKNPNATVEYTLFCGYIIFDGDKKVLVCETKNQAKIEKRIAKLRDSLEVNVIDAPEVTE